MKACIEALLGAYYILLLVDQIFRMLYEYVQDMRQIPGNRIFAVLNVFRSIFWVQLILAYGTLLIQQPYGLGIMMLIKLAVLKTERIGGCFF